MAEYTSISITKETKERLDKHRTTPKGEVGTNEFINYLLDKEERNNTQEIDVYDRNGETKRFMEDTHKW